MNEFVKYKTRVQRLFDYLQDKFGSDEQKKLITKQAAELEGLNSYLLKFGKYAAEKKGLNVILDYERHQHAEFSGNVFILGNRSSLIDCTIEGEVSISPMAALNYISCVKFKGSSV